MNVPGGGLRWAVLADQETSRPRRQRGVQLRLRRRSGDVSEGRHVAWWLAPSSSCVSLDPFLECLAVFVPLTAFADPGRQPRTVIVGMPEKQQPTVHAIIVTLNDIRRSIATVTDGALEGDVDMVRALGHQKVKCWLTISSVEDEDRVFFESRGL